MKLVIAALLLIGFSGSAFATDLRCSGEGAKYPDKTHPGPFVISVDDHANLLVVDGVRAIPAGEDIRGITEVPRTPLFDVGGQTFWFYPASRDAALLRLDPAVGEVNWHCNRF